MPFGLFDRRQPYNVLWRHLPHWEQAAATYFITWRTQDSMPRAVLDAWLAERDAWLQRHGLLVVRSLRDRKSGRGATGPQIPTSLQPEYRAFISERWESRLDECHGACHLSQRELARVVADSLLHFDGDRYAMGDFVVMPNHVHLLVCFPEEGQLLSQCRSWKQFTATQINSRLGRRGEFWEDDSFDHLVRTPEEFEHYRHYIADNPARAGLSEGIYLYRRALDCSPVPPGPESPVPEGPDHARTSEARS